MVAPSSLLNFFTIRNRNLPSGNYAGLAQAYQIVKKLSNDDGATIGALQLEIARLEEALGSHPGQQRVLEDQLKSLRFQAGLTEVVGPGIVVTLNDSKKMLPNEPDAVKLQYMIHDVDINQVVNELKASGSEAIAVNDQRLVGMSPIRCAGPTVFVNNVPETPPYQIQAIGDPKTLFKAMNLPGGVVDGYTADPAMIAVAKSNSLDLPAYQGPTQTKYAQPANTSRSNHGSAVAAG
jgi:uncharacterized protein YlxW (UPF0749 family)